MNYKKYNQILFISILAVIIFIIVFCYVINPFGVFSEKAYFFNKSFPELRKQERLTKVLQFKKLQNINTIFLGSSRVDFSISDKYYNNLTHQTSFNFAMQGSRFAEHKYLIEKAIREQPNLHTVIIGIDYDFYYLQGENDLSILKSYEKDDLNNYSSLLLSSTALGSSFTTLFKSLNPSYQKGFDITGVKRIFVNNKIDESFYKTINQYKTVGDDFKNTKPELSNLADLVQELRNKNIKVILYMQPAHSSMYEIIKQNGALDSLYLFKKELAKIQPFYDFYYPSVYSSEKIQPNMKYFFETSHCTFLVGEKILDKICLGVGEYGVLVNSQNIDEVHKNFIKQLEVWEKKNPEWVQKIKDIREG